MAETFWIVSHGSLFNNMTGYGVGNRGSIPGVFTTTSIPTVTFMELLNNDYRRLFPGEVAIAWCQLSPSSSVGYFSCMELSFHFRIRLRGGDT